ncbi:MAG: 6-phosphogluconolactonase, partial [Planctomycetota bacterium]
GVTSQKVKRTQRDSDPAKTIRAASASVAAEPVDVALVGIGENGHLAFNDPPADFDTDEPYLTVELDEPCRQQQVGEGWFESMAEVPTHAISMSIRQILKTRQVYCSVPDKRKAKAVRDTLCEPIGVNVPASALRQHANTVLVIDEAAASQLPAELLESAERIS